jgi:hypothetical protein
MVAIQSILALFLPHVKKQEKAMKERWWDKKKE